MSLYAPPESDDGACHIPIRHPKPYYALLHTPEQLRQYVEQHRPTAAVSAEGFNFACRLLSEDPARRLREGDAGWAAAYEAWQQVALPLPPDDMEDEPM